MFNRNRIIIIAAKSNEKQSSAKQNKSETSSREKTTKTPSTSLISQLLSAPPYFPVTSAAEILQSRQQKTIPELRAVKNIFMLAEAWEPELLKDNLFLDITFTNI